MLKLATDNWICSAICNYRYRSSSCPKNSNIPKTKSLLFFRFLHLILFMKMAWDGSHKIDNQRSFFYSLITIYFYTFILFTRRLVTNCSLHPCLYSLMILVRKFLLKEKEKKTKHSYAIQFNKILKRKENLRQMVQQLLPHYKAAWERNYINVKNYWVF